MKRMKEMMERRAPVTTIMIIILCYQIRAAHSVGCSVFISFLLSFHLFCILAAHVFLIQLKMIVRNYFIIARCCCCCGSFLGLCVSGNNVLLPIYFESA